MISLLRVSKSREQFFYEQRRVGVGTSKKEGNRWMMMMMAKQSRYLETQSGLLWIVLQTVSFIREGF
jgi:hypothetical protein